LRAASMAPCCLSSASAWAVAIAARNDAAFLQRCSPFQLTWLRSQKGGGSVSFEAQGGCESRVVETDGTVGGKGPQLQATNAATNCGKRTDRRRGESSCRIG